MRYFLALLLLCCWYPGYSQQYIPMPADSGAAWRYRIYDIDYSTHILDFILFLNGEDTSANGNVYHKIISRTDYYVVPNGYDPPITSLNADIQDTYYGAMRESNKKVYQLNGAGEILMFDFTVSVGDYIPAYSGEDQVIGIDSILVSGTYHKRYLTIDSTYYAIEGIGSNRGLIPQLNDGGGDVAFYCFTDSLVTYSPDTAIPCTFIYPIGYSSSVAAAPTAPAIEIYPVPANEVLHISVTDVAGKLQGAILNYIGQVVWSGAIEGRADLSTGSWPKGVYYLQINDSKTGWVIKKFIIE